MLLYLAQDLEQSPRPRLWAAFGLVAGLAGLTEPSILVVAVFLMALAAWRLSRAGKRRLAQVLVASFALTATILPWLIRDAVVFHRMIPMRDSMGLELRMGNNGYSERWTSDQKHPLHDAKELAAYDAGEPAYMDWKANQATGYIHDHPRWYVRMCARRALYPWTGYWSFDKGYLAMEAMDLGNIPFASCLTMLGLLGLWAAWQRRSPDAIHYGGVLFLFPVVYYFTHPEPYHMRPVDPLLVILGCFAIVTFKERAGREDGLAEAAPLDLVRAGLASVQAPPG